MLQSCIKVYEFQLKILNSLLPEMFIVSLSLEKNEYVQGMSVHSHLSGLLGHGLLWILIQVLEQKVSD